MKKIWTLFVLVFLSCNSQRQEIEFALEEAGENRSEIETVLKYYTKVDTDPLKLKAAQYLIRYMPYHFSYGEEIKDYYLAVDSVIALSDNKIEQEKYIKSLRPHFVDRYKQYQDIKVIRADFLIQSIDEAFEQWQHGKWASHLDFDEFCEYLLPYKCFEGQTLDNWRSAYYDICKGDIDNAYLCDDYDQSAFYAALEVNRQMKKATHQSFGLLTTLPIYDPGIIMKLPFAYCSTYCMSCVQIMRSKGIPVAYDFTPHWSNRKNGHSWNMVYTSRFGNLEFSPHETDPGTVHYPFLKMPKIFRTVYKPNEEYLNISTQKYIPPEIRNMFVRDVSAEYMPTVDVKVRSSISFKGRQHPFIAVYDYEDWTPVYWGKVSGRDVTFERMGLNTLYMALTYNSDGNYIPVSKPFLVTPSKKIEYITLDTMSYRTIKMTRKFPLGDNLFSIHNLTSGGVFEVADNREFRNAKKIAELPEWNLTNGSVSLRNDTAYRYWRFKSSDANRCDMAELFFYNLHDSIIRADIIDCGKIVSDNDWRASNISDGNQLTNFSVKGDDYWVGFDFGQPVSISKISYIRRCDGNSVQPGLEYSLYYWDNKGWRLIGNKTANDIFVEFENVPRKALLAIKCAQGEEQRAFICDENGKISWY